MPVVADGWSNNIDNRISFQDWSLTHSTLRKVGRVGGFGLVATCAAYVAPDGKGWPGELGVDRDDQVPRLAELAQAIGGHGGLVELGREALDEHRPARS